MNERQGIGDPREVRQTRSEVPSIGKQRTEIAPFPDMQEPTEPSPFAQRFSAEQRTWFKENGFHVRTLTDNSMTKLTEQQVASGETPSIGKRPRPEQQALFDEPVTPGEVAIKVYEPPYGPLHPDSIGMSAAEMFTMVGELNASEELPDGIMATVGSPGEIAQFATAKGSKKSENPYANDEQPYTLTTARYGIADDENVFVGGYREGRGMTVVARDPHRLDQLRNEPDVPFGVTIVYRPTTDIIEEEASEPYEPHGAFRYIRTEERRSDLLNAKGAFLQSAFDGDDAMTSAQLAELMYGTTDDIGEARARALAKNHLARVRPFFDAYGLQIRSIKSTERNHPNERHFTILPSITPETEKRSHQSNIVRDPAFFVLGYLESNRRLLETGGIVLPNHDETQAFLETSSQGVEFIERTQQLPPAMRQSHMEEIRRTAVRILRMATSDRNITTLQGPLQSGMSVLYDHITSHPEQADDLLYIVEHNSIAPVYERDGSHGNERHLIGHTMTFADGHRVRVPTNGNGNDATHDI